jgi:uncharacterized protein YqeY
MKKLSPLLLEKQNVEKTLLLITEGGREDLAADEKAELEVLRLIFQP